MIYHGHLKGKNSEFEALFIELENTSQSNTVVGVVYRHPGGNIRVFVEKMDDILQKINKEHKKIVLMGDFNIIF